MAKQLKDILKGVKASKVVPGSTGSDPGVDYAPKAPNEQEFVKKHATEKHSDRVGNGDDIYQATNIKHVLASGKEARHGYKKPEDQKVNEGKEEAKCNMTEAGTACPVHEMADCRKQKTLKEVLTKKTSAGDIIKDFQKSKDPKFAGKSAEERKRMALGAYYGMHPEKSKKTNEEVEQVDEAVRSSNEYRGYHGQAYQQHQGKDNANELAHKAFSGAHSKVKKHAGEAGLLRDVKKPNVMIKHYLDSTHGRHLHGNEGNAAYVKKDFAKFKSKYDPEHFKEEVERVDEDKLSPEDFMKGARRAGTGTDDQLKADTKRKNAGPGSGKIRQMAKDELKRRGIKEEVEQVDEVSKDTLQRYMHAAKPERMDPEKGKQRRAGMHLALKKVLGGDALGNKPKVKAAGQSKKEMGEDLAMPLLGDVDHDESAEMAKTQLRALANKALHLAMQLNDDQVVEPWVQSKIAVAKDHVTAVHDYMIYGDHSKDKETEQTAPYDGGIDMSGAPRDTYPNFSADVNTGRNV